MATRWDREERRTCDNPVRSMHPGEVKSYKITDTDTGETFEVDLCTADRAALDLIRGWGRVAPTRKPAGRPKGAGGLPRMRWRGGGKD